MPTQASVDAFIAQVASGDHGGTIADWYADDATTRENEGAKRGFEEIAWQTWKGEEIRREVFSYDPAWRKR